MKGLRLIGTTILAAAFACGDDDHGDHEFATYAECYAHHNEEGLTDIGATTECDAIFELEHADNADCVADHASDVSGGVPEAAIGAHCDSAFPL